jgi:hypothetical protein
MTFNTMFFERQSSASATRCVDNGKPYDDDVSVSGCCRRRCMVVMVPAEKHRPEDHRHRSKTCEGGRDVGLLVQGKAEFNKVQCPMTVQRPFNELECGCSDASHGGNWERPRFKSCSPADLFVV